MRQLPRLRIYRSVLDGEKMVNRLLRTDSIIRPPVKIPFLVDNLWEWVRPQEYPSRRFSAFASPQIEIARKQGPPDGEVFRIEFVGRYKICQLKGYSNAAHHPECISLPIALFEMLGNDWLRSSMESKIEVGRLWFPALSGGEVDSLFQTVSFLQEHREALRSLIRFWKDVKLIDPQQPEVDDQGEIFFEAMDGYYLRPLDTAG